ncbi:MULTISPECIES: DEAD/DEAH box helicase [unclassified Pseudoalteromonas]|uniref:DEAD/DEAH box helicase n=1 Tax=unclassified Pseudoalteromonas TaxID=194690 RepID=UPI0016005B39|nr:MULTISPECIES: ATP-binding domain-containing protein [unclassified Pseudoalteromonas]MBB1334916.1 ATP-binding domain-containing protein [Pseudoalteromonas sp. SR41-6]MBB1461550.1 ATP-binding domain-containing protein [Pseudoalteromonas sp. SG41-8]
MTMQFLPGSLEIDNIPYDLQIWNILRRTLRDLNGYCAYKIPVLGAPAPEDVPSFILVSKEHGITLIDVVHEKVEEILEDGRIWKTSAGLTNSRDVILEHYQDEIDNRLKRSPNLYNRRKKRTLVDINLVTVFFENDEPEVEEFIETDYLISEAICLNNFERKLPELISQNEWNGNQEQFDDILSLIEGTWDYQRVSSVTSNDTLNSINDFISMSLKRTFKQDSAQRQVSMQIPNGPQRIRGLAGTGKTVVLSLKAALSVIRLPHYKILYLFNTQSLYHSIEKQIGDYYAKEAKRSLPSGAIDVLHAWGGRTSGKGLYSMLCESYGIKALTLRDIPRGRDQLETIFTHLDDRIGDNFEPIYDLVLIDEAQDFPNKVFEVVHKITKDPKRIVVAYDDFQSLKDLKIREFHELFGKDSDGRFRFDEEALSGEYEGGVSKDFILPNCYRNPRNILMVAHGIALGVKRRNGVVDSVDRIKDWRALGYQVNSPSGKELIEAGDRVEVERLESNSLNLLEKLINDNGGQIEKLINVNCYMTSTQEISYIVNKIHKLIEEQGVKAHEIFVITLDTKNSEDFLKRVRSGLNQFGIKAIMPGYVESNRHFYEEDCVVLTTPFRAKGNETNIVFVSNCQGVTNDYTFKKRNSFFVAMTRSRGWCYISGYGDSMNELNNEINLIQEGLPKFDYIRPNDEAIARRRLLLSKATPVNEEDQSVLERLSKENPELLREFLQQQLDIE